MAKLPAPAAVLFVSDVALLSDFYRQVAAMAIVHAEADHVVMELQGFQLVIHKLGGGWDAQPGSVSVRDDSYIKLCLPVVSIDVARRIADSLGGSIKSTDHEWQARGFRACDGHDPEGNVFQVRESVA